MKKLLIIILLLIISIIIITGFTSCKEDFPDGPSLSKSDIEKNIKGIWEVESITVDEIDSTDAFKTSIGYYLDLNNLVEKSYVKVPILDNNKIEIKFTHANYSISSSTDAVFFKMGSTFSNSANFYPFGPFGPDIGSSWHILRLTENEMWINITGIYMPEWVTHTYYMKLKK
jgi:hypothetical protein